MSQKNYSARTGNCTLSPESPHIGSQILKQPHQTYIHVSDLQNSPKAMMMGVCMHGLSKLSTTSKLYGFSPISTSKIIAPKAYCRQHAFNKLGRMLELYTHSIVTKIVGKGYRYICTLMSMYIHIMYNIPSFRGQRCSVDEAY